MASPPSGTYDCAPAVASEVNIYHLSTDAEVCILLCVSLRIHVVLSAQH
jgi:hypothetical protein